jgi:hypothetical protein
MAADSKTRVPIQPADLAAYMDNTDNYQLEIVPPSTVANYVAWGWTATESAQWHAYRLAYDKAYLLIKDTENASKAEKLLNKAIHAYDNDKLIGHHLLDKVALAGTIADCQLFLVKRGTALASNASLSRTISPIKVEVITLHKSQHLLSQLLVVLMGQKGRAKPKGIKEIMVFKAVTAQGAAAPALSAYLYVGDVKRGLITVQHAATDEGNKAWFIAYTKTTKGILGAPSVVFSVTIM